MHVLFNTWLYFCRMTQTRVFIRAFAVANGSRHGEQLLHFSCAVTAVVVDLCDASPQRRFTPGLTRRPPARGVSVGHM